jgi:UDP-2,4-diacetamido-2,4,6-trideoxy-beta-L-altropyranose hydrolase
MKRAGWDCRLAWRDPTLATVPAMATAGFPALRLDGPETDEFARMTSALPDGIDLLIIDHYERGKAFESACRGWARRIAVIEDRPNRPHDCDILIDQTFARERAVYTPMVPAGCKILAGSDYAILRGEFARARPAALERRRRVGPLGRVLVSFGMADPENLSGMALGAIAASGIEVAVDVVLGTDAPHRAAVAKTHDDLPGGGTVYAFVEDMAALMVEANLAIGGAGGTSWERCCLGLPTLMFVLADNQEDIAASLAARGAAELLGTPDGAAAARLAARLRALAVDPDQLADMGEAAASVCDGLGAERVAEAVAAMAQAA